MPNPFKRIDVLILEVFGHGSKETNQKLDKLQASVDELKTAQAKFQAALGALQADVTLIKEVLIVPDERAANLSISLGQPAEKQ